MKQIFSISNVVLFLVAIIFAFAGALLVIHFGGDKLSAVLTSVAAGIVVTMIVGGIAEAFKLNISSNPVAGAIGALVGMLGVYLFL